MLCNNTQNDDEVYGVETPQDIGQVRTAEHVVSGAPHIKTVLLLLLFFDAGREGCHGSEGRYLCETKNVSFMISVSFTVYPDRSFVLNGFVE